MGGGTKSLLGIKGDVTIGAGTAERDPLLPHAFLDNGQYSAIASPADPRCFIIGRTGSGKSAAFRYLSEQYPDRVITLKPENLSLPYLTNLDVVNELSRIGVNLQPF